MEVRQSMESSESEIVEINNVVWNNNSTVDLQNTINYYYIFFITLPHTKIKSYNVVAFTYIESACKYPDLEQLAIDHTDICSRRSNPQPVVQHSSVQPLPQLCRH